MHLKDNIIKKTLFNGNLENKLCNRPTINLQDIRNLVLLHYILTFAQYLE